MRIIIIFSAVYFFAIMMLGTLGSQYAPFSPSDLSKDIAKVSSTLFAIYFLFSGYYFFIKKKSSLQYSNPWARSKLKYGLFLIFGIPICLALVTFANYIAFSKTIPFFYTKLAADAEQVEVVVTNKELWGKRDSHERIYISGFHQGFPVSRSFYNAVSKGQKLMIKIYVSDFGKAITFQKP